MRGSRNSAWTIVREATIAALACSVVGLVVNAVRPGGIPLIAEADYELFVPCPEPLGEVEGLDPRDPRIAEGRALRIDARSPEEYAQWHWPDAQNVPFDYLEGIAEATLRRIAASGAVRVVVYGDGLDPDSGRELARELAGRGVRNVFYVRGGAPALRDRDSARSPSGAEVGP